MTSNPCKVSPVQKPAEHGFACAFLYVTISFTVKITPPLPIQVTGKGYCKVYSNELHCKL